MPEVLGAGKADEAADVYEAVRSAVENRRSVGAMYHGRHRLFCPHRLGWNKDGQRRVLCYQFGGESESGLKPPGSPANWRCLAVDQVTRVELLEGVWQTAANHSRPASCITEADVDAEDYPEREPQQGH